MNRNSSILLLILLCVSASLRLDAATYYVDPVNGNDANNGTSTGTAWKTIPGTRTTNDSGFVVSAWGSITTSARIVENTTINLRPLYVYSGTNGGFIQMNGASGNYYTFGCTNIVIQADQTWGTGKAVIDFTGCVIPIGGFQCQIDGVTMVNLDIRNSDQAGIQMKEKGDGSALTNLAFLSCYFFNNGKSYLTDLAGSGDGQLNIREAVNVVVSNCVFNGDGNYMNGVLAGNGHQAVQNMLITGCIATNHLGDPVDNDAGIGFKLINNVGNVVSNTVSAWNLKGTDNGEENSQDAGPGGGAATLSVTWINCSASNNYWGINFNNSLNSSSPVATYRVINSLVVSNYEQGHNIYSGPFRFYGVHNIYDNNGAAAAAASPGNYYLRGHIGFYADPSETNKVELYFRNCIFMNSGKAVTFSEGYYTNRMDLTLNTDYNVITNSGYTAGNGTYCYWDWSATGPGGLEISEYEYGANGPGRASGNWYSRYGGQTSPAPAHGAQGHKGSDANTKGWTCTDSNFPAMSGYTITATYPMRNLNSETWETTEMLYDRNGTLRLEFTPGPWEFNPVTQNTPRVHGGIRGLRGF